MMLLERVAGPLVPSRVKIFTEIFEKMPRLATVEKEGADLSRKNLFYAHLLPAIRSYLSEEIAEKKKLKNQSKTPKKRTKKTKTRQKSQKTSENANL